LLIIVTANSLIMHLWWHASICSKQRPQTTDNCAKGVCTNTMGMEIFCQNWQVYWKVTLAVVLQDYRFIFWISQYTFWLHSWTADLILCSLYNSCESNRPRNKKERWL